jgi:hypothetical protein
MVPVLRSWQRSYALTVFATIALVASADFLFYRHVIGWSAAILAALLVAVIAFRQTPFFRSLGGRILLVASSGLLFALAEEPTWFNVTYLIVCLSAITIAQHRGWESDFVRWARRWAHWLVTGWTRLFVDNGLAMRWLIRHGVSPGAARSVTKWILPALLSLLFVGVFAWANPIISNWLSDFGNWLVEWIKRLPELFNLPRMFFWLAWAVVVWALLRGRPRRFNRIAKPARPVVKPNEPRVVAADVVVRCLILFNLIFALQNVLDLTYLWGHHAMPTGTEYKQYVRRGAYPLVAAALMAGAFVLITFRPGSETERSTAARKLVYLWIGQTILLTISAAWRLGRYIELTELTRLRVASAVWFLLVAIGLVYIVWRIVGRRDNRWLININALTALLILYPCCFVNFDGMISNFNAAHCAEAGGTGSRLDIEYFEDLGPTSVAALDSVRDQIALEPKRDRAQEISNALHAQLDHELSNWRGWTWRRQRTADAVQQMQLARDKSLVALAHANQQR